MITKRELKRQVEELTTENQNLNEKISNTERTNKNDQIERSYYIDRIEKLEGENKILKATNFQRALEINALEDRIKRCEFTVKSYRTGEASEVKTLTDKIKGYEYLTASYRAVIINMGKTLEREQIKNKEWL